MEKIKQWIYTITLYGKTDWSTHLQEHLVHQEVFSVTQTHTWSCYVVTWDEEAGQAQHIEADAIICPISVSKKIGVYMADCNNIAIMGKESYAVLHWSWKSLKDWIIENTLQHMVWLWDTTEDLEIYIWPSIRVDDYEVGDEFADLFDQKHLPEYNHEQKGKRYHLDMVLYIQDILSDHGIQSWNIQIHPNSTYSDNDKRFSYRKGDEGLRNFMAVEKRKI